MKILKYLLIPAKYLLLLLAITSLIYYRSIIFHSNVNQYIDNAISYVEQRFDINIPKHQPDEVIYTVAIETNNIPTQTVPASDSSGPEINDTQNTKSLISETEHKDNIINNESVDTIDKNSNSIEEKVIHKDYEIDHISELSKTINVLSEKVELLLNTKNETTVVENDPANDVSLITSQATINRDDNVNIIDDSSNPSSINHGTSDINNMLAMARQSFWNGNTQVSEKFYLDLAQLEVDDPDIYGELGNVYYAQGKWKEAGRAYYEAAIRLLAIKQDQQVSYLLRVIQGLDSESAEKLRHRISG